MSSPAVFHYPVRLLSEPAMLYQAHESLLN